jgi:hypothetical protein
VRSPDYRQQVAIGAGSVATSNPFNNLTTLIRVHTDAVCCIAMGVNPTAVNTKMRLAANQTEYFAVPPGSNWKLAVITNT